MNFFESVHEVLRRGKERVLWLIHFFQYRNPTVLFTSFEGQYNDNPKYISEELHKLDNNIKIIWATSWKGKDSVPEYVKSIPYCSFAFQVASVRSHVLVDNVIGYRWRFAQVENCGIKKKLQFRNQLNISTWHGTPIKKIGRHEYGLKDGIGFISSCDYMISGCRYTQDRLTEAFYPIPVRLTGTPRNDILVNGLSEKQIIRIKEKLGLPDDKKIILFAPTFRKSSVYSGMKQMSEIDIPRLIGLVTENITHEDCVFVYRVHHTVLKELEKEKIAGNLNGLIFDGNKHDDMAEYLAVTDVLVTDYSGSVFDFALTGRPCFLYTPDKDHYINEERGTYIPLEDLPYPHAVKLEDFYQLIEEYDESIARHRIDEFNQRIGNAETGQASETIAKGIIKYINTGKKENLL